MTKEDNSMRRSTVLSLPLQSVVPVLDDEDDSGAFTIKTENSLGIQNALAYLADVE